MQGAWCSSHLITWRAPRGRDRFWGTEKTLVDVSPTSCHVTICPSHYDMVTALYLYDTVLVLVPVFRKGLTTVWLIPLEDEDKSLPEF